jgi:dihydroxyacetone kinase
MVQYAIDNTATLGVAFDHCHVPGSSSSFVSLGPNELELGMGIHNETGFLKTNMMPAKQLVTQMMNMLVDQNDKDRSYLNLSFTSTSVVMLVNNAGGTAMLELNVVVKEAVEYLGKMKNIVLERVFIGSFVTSLNMPGFSITLLTVDHSKNVLDLLDQKVSIPAWPSTPALSFSTNIVSGEEEAEKRTTFTEESTATAGPGKPKEKNITCLFVIYLFVLLHKTFSYRSQGT